MRVAEDFSAQGRCARASLWPFLWDFPKQKRNAYIRFDKLIEDEAAYVYDDVNKKLISDYERGPGLNNKHCDKNASVVQWANQCLSVGTLYLFNPIYKPPSSANNSVQNDVDLHVLSAGEQDYSCNDC